MPNEYYSHTGYPQNSDEGQAVDLRAELLALQAAFDKNPALLGHGEQLIIVKVNELGLQPIPIGKYRMGDLWVPRITCATPGDFTIVYSTRVGVIHRFGQLICLQWDLVTSTFTHTTASGIISINDVPIISANIAALPGTMAFSGLTKANYHHFVPVIGGSANTIQMEASGTGQAKANLAITDFPTGGTVKLSGTLVYLGSS